MGLETAAILSIVGGVAGAAGAMQQASAAEAAADARVQELERQKEETRLNARSEKSDRAREADRAFASMIASMADNGGLGTSNAAGFAGSIGFESGMDMARIEGNAVSKINSLASQQRSARMEAANARSQAQGAAFSSLISGAGGAFSAQADARHRRKMEEMQKQNSGLGRR